MHQSLPSPSGPHDFEETEEPVLVEAQEFSEDDENFAQAVEGEDDHLDFDYDEDEEEQDEDEEFESDEEMKVLRVGLHDLNTLRHLFRFGLLKTSGGTFTDSIISHANI
jgi:hypothetical protein